MVWRSLTVFLGDNTSTTKWVPWSVLPRFVACRNLAIATWLWWTEECSALWKKSRSHFYREQLLMVSNVNQSKCSNYVIIQSECRAHSNVMALHISDPLSSKWQKNAYIATSHPCVSSQPLPSDFSVPWMTCESRCTDKIRTFHS